MLNDCITYAKRCDKCQRFALEPHLLTSNFKGIIRTWPFTKWGINIVEPLPIVIGQRKFLIVATDYLSK